MRLDAQSDTALLKGCIRLEKKAWDAFVEKYNCLICHAIVCMLNRYAVPLENQIVEELFHMVFVALPDELLEKKENRAIVDRIKNKLTTRCTGDNLGNHTATANIKLNGHWLSVC